MKKFNNVLALAPFPYYGGLQEFAIENACRLGTPLLLIGSPQSAPGDLAERMKRCGIDVKWIHASHTFMRVPVILKKDNYLYVKKYMKEFSLVHFHGPYPFVSDILLGNINYIFTYHYDIALKSMMANSIAKIYSLTLLNKTLKESQLITVSNRFFINDSLLLRRYWRKIKILPLGIDTKRYIPKYKYKKRIIFVGRIIPEKGIHVLVEAFKMFLQKNPDFKLIIIGKIVDVNYFKYIHSLIKNYNLYDNVVFTGYLPKHKLVSVLAEATVCVLPSLNRLESFGIVLLEASALGIPVIATNVIPGAREFISKAKNGILVEPHNPKALASALEKISKNPEKYGRRGRRYVVKYHDWDRVTSISKSIYESVIEHIE